MTGLPVLAVLGPTASGKSDLAVSLARRLSAEIVNADSMQLYAGLDIGTAKLSLAERGGIAHHLLDVWPISRSASVADYQHLAREVIATVHARGKIPILVGGSGLYVRAALDRLEFPGESAAIRERLYGELELAGPGVLHARLAAADPTAAAAILASNGRRIVRALEVIELTGRPFTATMPPFESVFRSVQIGVDRADVDERVEFRVRRMMQQGLLEEVRALLPVGLRASPTAGKALGYAQLLACLDDAGAVRGNLVEAEASTVRATRRFVRRQRSWFGKDPRTHWYDAARPDLLEAVVRDLRPMLEG